MKPEHLLTEVEDALVFALKQADACQYPGHVTITKARAKTLLNDIRAAKLQSRKVARLHRLNFPKP